MEEIKINDTVVVQDTFQKMKVKSINSKKEIAICIWQIQDEKFENELPLYLLKKTNA